jgi:DivIVA domain-containing protein
MTASSLRVGGSEEAVMRLFGKEEPSFRRGYNEDDVDEFLDRVEEQLRRK